MKFPLCGNMLSKRFWVFQKNLFIKKSEEQSKNKERKTRYESLLSISMVYDSSGAHLGFSEGRGLNFRKTGNQ